MSIPCNSFGVLVRELQPGEAEHIRAEIVRKLLCEILGGLKEKLDPAGWHNAGWAELQDFTEALCAGGMHPALVEWQVVKDHAGHPALPSRELYVRRLAVLLVIALHRIGLSKGAAQNFAAAELERAGVFERSLKASVIRHWRRDYPLTPDDELLLATGIATAGRDARKVALYFIGLSHLVNNPTAVAVREQEGIAHYPPGYLGNPE